MSQLSVQTSIVRQLSETAPTQGTGAVSSAGNVPAALLARLSGSGADKPAFDPACLHKDSFLPSVADKLATRPLGDSEGARAAAKMRELTEELQGRPVTDEELFQLDELRSRAWKSKEGADAGAYCDTLAGVVLLRPLMEKLGAVGTPEARAQLADVLHRQLDRLLSAETPQDFDQITSELRATQELFRQQGVMGPEQEGAFKKLDDVLQLHRKVYTETFPALEKEAEKAKGHEASSRTLDSVLQDAEALKNGLLPGGSKIPFGQMGLRPLQERAGRLASELRKFPRQEVATAREFVTRAGSALENGENAEQLEALQKEYRDKLDMGALPPHEREQVDNALQSMGSRVRALRAAAQLEESHFANNIAEAIKSATTAETYDRLWQEIDAHLEKLPENLSPEGRDAATAELRDLARQCLTGQFKNLVKDAQSTRRHTPSLAECAERLNEVAQRRKVDPAELRAWVEKSSADMAGKLEARMTALQESIPSMSAEDLRRLRLEDIADTMKRCLLPKDGNALEGRLESLLSRAEEALYEKTAGLELKEELSGLDDSQKATLKAFCIKGGCDPSLISILHNADSGSLRNLLEAAGRIFADTRPDAADIKLVDEFLLPHPELDGIARLILSGDGREPDYRFDDGRNRRDLSIVIDKFFSRDLKSKLGLQKDAPVDADMLQKLVQLAAEGCDGQDEALQELDMALIQALWYAEKVQNPELSFDSFKQDLPRPFSTMPMLKGYLDAGIRGSRDQRRVGQILEDVSLGLGSTKTRASFLSWAMASNAKWAADAAFNKLLQLLGKNHLSDLSGVCRDAMQDKPQDVEKQRERDAGSAVAEARGLFIRKAAMEEALRAMEDAVVRRQMAERLGIDALDPGTVRGATLATGILMTEKILSDGGASNEQMQKMLKCVQFQTRLFLDGKKLEGHGGLWGGDTQGKEFRNALKTLCNADLQSKTDQDKFETARQKILCMCSEPSPSPDGKTQGLGLKGRSEAVLFFKKFLVSEATGQMDYEFQNLEIDNEHIKGLDDDIKKKLNACKNAVARETVNIIGAGQRLGKSAERTELNIQEISQNVAATLENALKNYTKEEEWALSTAASLAVCEQFAQSETLTTVADIQVQFERNCLNLKGWSFYNGCLAKMKDMGFPEAQAELFLQKTISDMKEDFFAGLAQKGLQKANLSVVIDQIVGGWMKELEEPGKSLAFGKTDGVSVEVPVLETGVVDVSALLELARQNGICVWKDNEHEYHMTLMNGARIGVGMGLSVGMEHIVNAVEVSAGGEIEGNIGCDLTFPNKTQCHMFLSGLLSGSAAVEHLGLCKEVRRVTEVGVGASAGLSLGASISLDDTEIFSADISANWGKSSLWKTVQNGEQEQHTRTVCGTLSLAGGVSVGPENIQEQAATVGEKLDDLAFIADLSGDENLAETLQGLKPQLSVEISSHYEFEEQSSVTTKTVSGILEGAERVRSFVLDSKFEAAMLLREAGVSRATIRDVYRDLKKLPDGASFRIELASNMRQDAVQAYNKLLKDNKTPSIYEKDFALQEVRLVTEDSIEQSFSINLRIATLQSARSFSRTHTETYDARPVQGQAA